MANYRQAKLAVHTFRCLASTTVTRAEPISRVYSTKPSSLASKPAKFPGFSPYSYSILHNSVPHKTQLRCYHVDLDLHLVEWFHKNWFWVLVTPVPFWLGGWMYPLLYGSYLMAKNGTFETVPYTKRRHLVVVSYSREKELGDKYFEESKNSKYKGKIMPATHPHSERVNQIANNIIDALKRSESEQALVELNWEFLVVDDPIVDASALAGGKIVVYTGLLEHLASDAEVATIIAHEVGHVVARHQSEWRAYMEEFLVHMLKLRLTDSTVVSLFFFFEDIVAARWLKWFPFIRLKEFEADHIGMILMASAGYDPRVALTMLEKFDGKVEAMPCRCNANRPSGKERIEMLARAKIMDEALTIYDAVLRPSSLHSPDQPQPK